MRKVLEELRKAQPARPDNVVQLDAIAVTVPQALILMNVSRSFLYKKFETGEIRRLKAGKRVLIMRDDILVYLQRIRT